jgi:transposase
MNEQHERRLRRKAIRLKLLGFSVRQIAQQLQRSVGWVVKWWQRYQASSSHYSHSQSRRPHTSPQRYAEAVRNIVRRVRQSLLQRRVGRLIGSRAIQRTIRQAQLLPPSQRPAPSTIQRMLHEGGLIAGQRQPSPAYCPQPQPRADYVIQALDWTMRYLHGGSKVYAFHTVDLHSRALHQTLSTDKRSQTAQQHVLHTWQRLGLPDALQMDNDVAWCGTLQHARHIGTVLRLCLYCGVEPILLPFAEPEHNGVVEWINALWSQQFWNLHTFSSVAQVRRYGPQFVEWYQQQYEPPHLTPHTPQQVHQRLHRQCLTSTQRQRIPARLPLTAGRMHFIRRVDPQGQINVLAESWHIHQRLAGHYVWATLSLHEQVLRIYYRRSADAAPRLLKVFPYPLPEPVLPLRSEFKRRKRRRNMFTML